MWLNKNIPVGHTVARVVPFAGTEGRSSRSIWEISKLRLLQFGYTIY